MLFVTVLITFKDGALMLVLILNSSSCRGPPYCRRPHSRKEFQEWENRWLHRQYRKKDGINRNTSPRMNAYGEGLPISASKVSTTRVETDHL